MASGRGDPQSKRANVQEDRRIEIYQPLRRPDRLGEKVALPERGSVNADEFCPWPTAAIGGWGNALCLEDRLHDLPRDLCDTELAKLTQYAGVDPRVLTDNSQDEFANVTGRPDAPSRPRCLIVSDVRCLELSYPSEKGVVADD